MVAAEKNKIKGSFKVICMSINRIRSRLISIGYSPSEVEYSLSEILQHKKPDLLNQTDVKILITMLEERIQFRRAVSVKHKNIIL